MLSRKILNALAIAAGIYSYFPSPGWCATGWSDLIDEGNRFELLHNYPEAKRLYLQAFDLAKNGSKDPAQIAESQARLGAVCVAQHNLKDAEHYTDAALELALAAKRTGHESEEVMVCMEDLAGAYLDESPESDKERCFKKAIEIRQKLFGANHPNLARSYGALAILYMDEGRFSEAVPLINKSLAIKSRTVNSGNYSLTKQILHHAVKKYDKSDIVATEKFIQIVDDIETRTNSDRYRSTLDQFKAIIAADRGKGAEAEKLFKQAIRHDEVSHPVGGRLANSYAQLARFYCQQHQDKKAKQYFDLARATAIKGHTKNLERIVADQNRCANHSGAAIRPILNLRMDH